jgi:hypothetical protein
MRSGLYNGHTIGEDGDFLSLTDMWRAAGSDPSKRPVIWLRQAGTEKFLNWLSGELKVTVDHLYHVDAR